MLRLLFSHSQMLPAMIRQSAEPHHLLRMIQVSAIRRATR
jgi:hypothetical protein